MLALDCLYISLIVCMCAVEHRKLGSFVPRLLIYFLMLYIPICLGVNILIMCTYKASESYHVLHCESIVAMQTCHR